MGSRRHRVQALEADISFPQEETGYKVSPENVKALGPAIASAGTSGAQHFMFYAEVGRRTRPGSHTPVEAPLGRGCPIRWTRSW